MICFIELKRNENGLVEAIQSLKTACCRAYLNQYNIKTVSYISNSLTSINDVADDILSIGNTKFIFIVNEDCIGINRAIINYMLDDEDVDIYYTTENVDVTIEGAHCISMDIESDLRRFFLSDTQEMKNALTNVSPYLENIISQREILKYGIWIGDKTLRDISIIREELKISEEIYSAVMTDIVKILIFEGDYIQEPKYYKEITALISDMHIPNCTYIVPIGQGILSEIDLYDNIKYSIIINDEISAEEDQKLSLLISKYKIVKICFNVELLVKSESLVMLLQIASQNPNVEICPNGIIDKSNIQDKIWDIINFKTKMKYYTFYRGFLKSRTGLYEGINQDGFVHHLELDAKHIKDMDYNVLNDIMSLNSSVFVNDTENVLNIDNERNSLIYFDKSGMAHVYNGKYNKIIKCLGGENFAWNIVCLDESRLSVNDYAYMDCKRYKEVVYSWAHEHISYMKSELYDNKTIYFIDIVSEEDYKYFLADAEKYKETHRIDDLPLSYGYLRNACRFINQTECAIDKIARLVIDSQGKMHFCDKNIPSKMNVENVYELTHNCFVNKEKLLSDRECYDCNVSWCAKCVELPSFMRENYCDISKKQSYVQDYVLMPHILTSLRESRRGYQLLELKGIKISNEHMFNLIDENVNGDVAPYFPKYTTCILSDDENLLWSPKSGKYYKLNVEFMYFIELLLKRKSMSYIEEILSKRYNISSEETRQNIKTMVDVLQNANLLYRKIEDIID